MKHCDNSVFRILNKSGDAILYAQFGPAGNPDAFYQTGKKASAEMPRWLSELGLTAYEYQCSRGANIREETARTIGEQAQTYNIKLSIHAPYYISLATEDDTIASNTRRHFLKSLQAAIWMGADRVIFHIGGVGKQERRVAMARATKRFEAMLEEIEQQGLTGVYLAPETMGKQNQLGTVDEVVSLCKLSPWVIPAIDFAHLHAVTAGRYTTKSEYKAVFDMIGENLGEKIACNLHIHFSKIEFTKIGGEKRHWTFNDPFGPPHELLIELCAERGYTPRIICESAGTQAADAKIMQDLYFTLLNKIS